MVERQQVNQGTKAQSLRALRDRGEPDAGRWSDAKRRRMVFRDVIAVEACAIIGFDEPKPVGIETVQWDRAAIHMVEYAKSHKKISRTWTGKGAASEQYGRVPPVWSGMD